MAPEKVFHHTISLMYHMIRMFVDRDANMVLDHVLLCDEKLRSDNGETTLDECKKVISGINMLSVKVECPIEA